MLPQKVSSDLRSLNHQIDMLSRQLEDRLGPHFKIFKLFWELLEKNPYVLENPQNKKMIEPLRIFAQLNRVKGYKDKLMLMIRKASRIVINAQEQKQLTSNGIQTQQSKNNQLNVSARVIHGNDELENLEQIQNPSTNRSNINQGLFEEEKIEQPQNPHTGRMKIKRPNFDETAFYDKCQQESITIEIEEIQYYIREFEDMVEDLQRSRKVTESDLLPIYDTMTQLFDDQIEDYIERKESNLSLREVQAFYKIRTRILHGKITELNHLVEAQNEDIRGTRGQYTDELLTLRDEVSYIRNMASQLEIVQNTSADFYSTNGGGGNNDRNMNNNRFNNNLRYTSEIDNGNSFENNIFTRGSEATRSLYEKAQDRAKNHNKNQFSGQSSSKQNVCNNSGTQRRMVTNPNQQAQVKNFIKKRKSSKTLSNNTRGYVRSQTDHDVHRSNNNLYTQTLDSRSASQMSNGFSNNGDGVDTRNGRNTQIGIRGTALDPSLVYQQNNVMGKTYNPKNTVLSVDKEFETSRQSRQITKDQQMLGDLFTQSPIHGSAAPHGKSNIFGSVDDFIRESATDTQYNSAKKHYHGDDDDCYQTNDPAITDFLLTDGRMPSSRSNNTQKSNNYGGVNTHKSNLNLNLNTDENLATYESTSQSNQDTMKASNPNSQRINQLFSTNHTPQNFNQIDPNSQMIHSYRNSHRNNENEQLGTHPKNSKQGSGDKKKGNQIIDQDNQRISQISYSNNNNQRPDSSSSNNDLERNLYLDESIDKIEERKDDDEDLDDNYDISPDNYEIGFGQSNRSPNHKENNQIGTSSNNGTNSINNTLRKMVSDRMTPEFKLCNDDFILRESRTNSSVRFDDYDLSPRMESLLMGIDGNPLRNSSRKVSNAHNYHLRLSGNSSRQRGRLNSELEIKLNSNEICLQLNTHALQSSGTNNKNNSDDKQLQNPQASSGKKRRSGRVRAFTEQDDDTQPLTIKHVNSNQDQEVKFN
eukprot:403374873